MLSNRLPSALAIAELAYFQPDLRKIKMAVHNEKETTRYLLDDSATAVQVVGVFFTEGKIYYDLIVPNGEGSFYRAAPLMRVDSIMVHGRDSRAPLQEFETEIPAYWLET